MNNISTKWLSQDIIKTTYSPARGIHPNGKPNSEYPRYLEYDAQECVVELDDYYDISVIRVTFSKGKTFSYLVQVADDPRIWFNIPNITFLKDDCIFESTIFESYRKYIKVQIKGDNITPRDIISIEINGIKTERAVPLPKRGEKNGVACPCIIPRPDGGVSSLDGIWRFCSEPTGDWMKNVDVSDWCEVLVPAISSVSTGLDFESNSNNIIETGYKSIFVVPKTAEGKKVILRFESVVSVARVWLNGTLMGINSAPYSTFDLDITDYINVGKENLLAVGVCRVPYTVTFGWQGIVGPVSLLITEKSFLTRVVTEVDLDNTYTDGNLFVELSAFLEESLSEIQVELILTDYIGNIKAAIQTIIKPPLIDRKAPVPVSEIGSCKVTIKVPGVDKWEAEHPYLYTLTVSLKNNDQVLEKVTRKVGFRKIVIIDKEFHINGNPIYMRGVNWINLNPLGGYSFEYESDKESLLKLKKANVNMIRTSHHPQYDSILALCDELGLYVELETGPHIICKWTPCFYEAYDSLDNPLYEDWFFNLYAAMVERGRSHASVLYYSAGNESDWGRNIAKGCDYIHAIDPTRPIKYSWGYLAPDEYVDILSCHYIGDLPDAVNKMTIWDEYAHPYTNNQTRLEKDPGMRWTYGPKLKREWEQLRSLSGGIGAAIWHARDWTVLTPHGAWQSFQTTWGLMDIWNREKPEYYDTKKVYSPVKMDDLQRIGCPEKDQLLVLEVENRYDFTNLSELVLRVTTEVEQYIINMPSISPRKSGSITFLPNKWKNGEHLKIEFIRPCHEVCKDYIVDTQEFIIGGFTVASFDVPSGKPPEVFEDAMTLTVSSNMFSMIFNKNDGRIINGVFDGTQIICGGGEITLGFDLDFSNWMLLSMKTRIDGCEVVLEQLRHYEKLGNVSLIWRIDGTGRIDIGYNFILPDEPYITEIGITLIMPAETDKLSWNRRADCWSYYTMDNINRIQGSTHKRRVEGIEIYGKKPLWPWNMDEEQYRLGRHFSSHCTADFRSSKKNIYNAEMRCKNGTGLRVESDGHGSVRASIDNNQNVQLHVCSEWAVTAIGEFEPECRPLPSKAGDFINHHVVVRFIK